MHGFCLKPQTQIGINEMDDAMVTATTPPETASVPATSAGDDSPEAPLRTLSTKTYCRTVWTPGIILRRILERERTGLSLNASSVQRDSINLWCAARRLFGSWDRAVVKARSAGAGRIVAHTRDTIIARLLEHAATGLPMSTVYPLTKACYKPAVRLFGSWSAAVRAAGLEPLERKAKYAPPSTNNRFLWTKDLVVEKIRARQQLRLSTQYRVVRREAQDLLSAARRLFGSWRAARYAAEMLADGKCDYSREQILNILRERGRIGKPVSSLHPDMQPYLSAARRLFGSWTKAREDAGCSRPKSYTKDEVLAALFKALDEDRVPRIRAPDLRPYVPAARRIFGKWIEAVRQAHELWSKKC